MLHDLLFSLSLDPRFEMRQALVAFQIALDRRCSGAGAGAGRGGG